MFKKLTTTLFVFALILSIPHLAWSTIEGQWYVQVTDKIKIKDTGKAAQKYFHDYIEDWVFNSDGTCEMEDVSCTWYQERNNYIITLDENELKDKLSAAVYADTGQEIVINLISLTSKIKQNKDGSLKAKLKVTGTCVFQDDGSIGKLNYRGKALGSFINENYSLKWAFSATNVFDSAAVIGSDGTIYASNVDRNLYAINPWNGSLKWKFTADRKIVASPVIGSDGVIYVGAYDNYLYAINPNGSQKWAFSATNVFDSAAVIGSDGTIYASNVDRNLYAINPWNGSLKWKFTAEKQIIASPVIGSDGTIYVGAYDNYIYAIIPN